MATAVDTLEAVLQNNECKLDVILCKLEECFAKFEDEQSVGSNVHQKSMNPMKIMSELKDIKRELSEVKQMYSDLQDYKKQTNEELKSESAVIEEEINAFLHTFNKV